MVSDKKDPDENGEFRSSDEKTKIGFFNGPGCVNTRVEYFSMNGYAIAEGDICLGTDEELKSSSDPKVLDEKAQEARSMADIIDISSPQEAGFIKDQKYRWPNCTIPYEINPSLPNQNRITDAMTHWTDRTGIKFVKRTNQQDYLYFTDLGGCWSYIGRQGGKQNVSLSSGCSTGNTIHEIGHAIGLYHEQSRNDRDTYVTINWQNITSGKESNFSQYLNNGIDVGGYDYGSIMHYPRNAFSKNGQDTITPLLSGAQNMGQRTALSSKDVAATRQMYPGCYKSPIKDIKVTNPITDRITLAVVDRKTPTIARLDIKPTLATVDLRTIPTIDQGTPASLDTKKLPVLDKNPIADRIGPKTIGDRIIPTPRVVVPRILPSRLFRDPYQEGYDPYAESYGYDPYAESYGYEEGYDPYAESYGYEEGYDPYAESYGYEEGYDPYAESYGYEEGYDPYAPFVLSTPHMAPDWEAIDEALAPQQPLTKNPNIDARIPHIPKSPRRDIPKMPFRDTYPRRDIPKMPFRDTYPSIDIRKRPGYDTNPLTDRF